MADAIQNPETITINGDEYEIDRLSQAAQVQVQNIRFCDAQIRQLESEWAIADTARLAYSSALKREQMAAKA